MARGVRAEEDFVSWWCSGHNKSLDLVKGVLWWLYDMKELFTEKEFKSSIFNYYGGQVQLNV
jgi:hypothetical protein